MTHPKDEAKATRPHHDLIAELLNPNIPKTEREHAASREIERLQALAAPTVQEPVATISITQRGSTRTIDNHFSDCVRDWPDGEYKLVLATPPVAPVQPVQPVQEHVAWEMFPAYLIDKCEGEIITEEGLQRSFADMLADPAYATPPAAEFVCSTGLCHYKALPDAIHHTDLSEHPEYISGWNDYRKAMMEMMK